MTRKIFIDCQMETEGDVFPDFGDRTRVRTNPRHLTFTATLFVNDRRSVIKKFKSVFRDWEDYDEQQLADVIFKNFYAQRAEIYDVPNPPEEVGDELIIEFSPYAKECFDFLKKHTRKLLGMLSPQI